MTKVTSLINCWAEVDVSVRFPAAFVAKRWRVIHTFNWHATISERSIIGPSASAAPSVPSVCGRLNKVSGRRIVRSLKGDAPGAW